MRRRLAISAMFALAATAFPASPPAAQTPARIAVGAITAAQLCKVYMGVDARSSGFVAGSSAGYVGAFGAGGASSLAAGWESSIRTYFVKDCVNQFAGVKTAMQAALASSGTVVVGPGGLLLRGRVENVTPIGSAYRETTNPGGSYGASSGGLAVTMSFTISDRGGRIIYGDIVKSILETDFAADTRGTGYAGGMGEDGQYAQLQRIMAIDVARKVAFHFRPLRVTSTAGKTITINYGAPFIEQGMIINVTSAATGGTVKFRIASASDGSATAQSLSGREEPGIEPASRVSIADPGEPVMDRVELP